MDYIYYDLILNNETVNKKELKFDDKRNDIIIKNINEYYISCIRFNIDLRCLVKWIPDMQDVANTVYNLGVKSSTYSKFLQVQHIPNDSTLTPPSVLNDNYFDDEYFYYYSFTSCLNIFNQTLKTLNNDLVNNGAVISSAKEPFFQLEENNMCSLNIDPDYITKNIQIIFNEDAKINSVNSFTLKQQMDLK